MLKKKIRSVGMTYSGGNVTQYGKLITLTAFKGVTDAPKVSFQLPDYLANTKIRTVELVQEGLGYTAICTYLVKGFKDTATETTRFLSMDFNVNSIGIINNFNGEAVLVSLKMP
jgi:hypothetical protein